MVDNEEAGSIATANDNYMPGAAVNTRQSKSTKDSFSCAKKHFNKFLGEYLDNEQMDNLEQLAHTTLSPNRPWTYTNLHKEYIPWKLMDLFGDYLSCHATSARAGAQATHPSSIAYNTAARYFSAIRTGIVMELMEEGKHNPALANVESMKIIYQGMRSKFTQDTFNGNHNLVNPHKPSDLDDILTTAICCIWTASYPQAAFYCYFLSMIQLAGRATEVAKVPWWNLALVHPAEFDNPHEQVAEITLWRSKTSNQQTCSIFPHRDTFLQDWYFALGYSMVMQRANPTDYLFPMFAAKAVEAEATRTTPNDKEAAKNTAVTQLFNNMLRDLMSQCAQLTGKTTVTGNHAGNLHGEHHAQRIAPTFVTQFCINSHLTSHSNKKHAVMIADEVPALKSTWVCFRAGWLKQSAHTIFDYLVSNQKNDWQVGKALSGWRHQDVHGRIGGGHPPHLQPILHHNQGDAVDDFTTALFWQFDVSRCSGALKSLLTASILMYLRKFIQLLLEHPQQKFGVTYEEAWNNHPFLQSIALAAQSINIVSTTLLEWGTLVEQDFTQCNYGFASFQNIQELEKKHANPTDSNLPHNQVDERSVVGFLFSLADVAQETISQVRQLQDDDLESHQSLSRSMNGIAQSQQKLCQEMCRLQQAVLQITPRNQMLGQHTQGSLLGSTLGVTPQVSVNQPNNETEVHPTSQPAVLSVINPYPNGLKSYTVCGLYESWHVFGHYKSLYNNEVKKEHWSPALLTIEYFSLFLPNHPSPLPTGVMFGCHPAATSWRNDLNKLIAVGWNKVKQMFQDNGQ